MRVGDEIPCTGNTARKKKRVKKKRKGMFLGKRHLKFWAFLWEFVHGPGKKNFILSPSFHGSFDKCGESKKIRWIKMYGRSFLFNEHVRCTDDLMLKRKISNIFSRDPVTWELSTRK